MLSRTGEAEEEEEEEDDVDGESSDEEGEEDLSMTEEPGNDSGCTAVVALLRGTYQFSSGTDQFSPVTKRGRRTSLLRRSPATPAAAPPSSRC